MKLRIVFCSYINSPDYHTPADWLNRTEAYNGMLEKLAQHHTVISLEQISYTGDYEKNGVTYYFRDFIRRKNFLPFRQHRFIRKLNPDVVIVHGLHFYAQTIQLRKILGSKVIIIGQHHAERAAAGWRRRLQQWSTRCLDACLFTSREMGMEWVEKGNIEDEKKVREVMEASSVFHTMDRLDARLHTGISGKHVYLWVGRLNDNKDPLTVVKAFLDFLADCPSAKLYMIYHTSDLLVNIQALLVTPAYKEAIVFVGQKPHAELLYWFNSVDFIISGSHYEGSGIAICEGMSCGCIPLLTNILSFKKLTGYGQCGLLYEPGNSLALLQILRHSLTLDIHEARTRTIAQYEAHLSFTAIARDVMQVISSLQKQI